jgi:hypothetical protein
MSLKRILGLGALLVALSVTPAMADSFGFSVNVGSGPRYSHHHRSHHDHYYSRGKHHKHHRYSRDRHYYHEPRYSYRSYRAYPEVRTYRYHSYPRTYVRYYDHCY